MTEVLKSYLKKKKALKLKSSVKEMMTRENKKNNNNTQITQVYIHTHTQYKRKKQIKKIWH